MKSLKIAVAGLALAFSAGVFAADWASGSTAWSALPEIKVTKFAMYLTPKQAYDMKTADPKAVALFDVRTRAEAMYVGMASTVDALVPFVEHQEIMSDWDERRTMYKLDPNQDFVPEIERRMAELGLAKDAPVILLCRSGDRSSKAADRLQAAGYTKVYSVPEGFEGDRASDGPKKGQRVINGWKNADLPWSYRLEKSKMYFPR
jgi:rhodanese-related sulfurtransferase